MIKRITKKFKKMLTTKNIVAKEIPVLYGTQLSDKIVLITGASSGIGFGIAQAIISNGGKVIITGRDTEKLNNACKSLGENARYLEWDASSTSLLETNLENAIKIFGRIDALINNAGYHGNQDFLTITESDYNNTFDTNLKFVFFLSQAISKYFIKNKIEGNILNISSASSMKPAWSPYEISKWGVRGFTRGLARELAPHGIVVNGIAPGPCATQMSNYKEGDFLNWNNIPSGRMSLPIEIGNLAVFLISSAGRNILGETIFCDGGSGLLTMNK